MKSGGQVTPKSGKSDPSNGVYSGNPRSRPNHSTKTMARGVSHWHNHGLVIIVLSLAQIGCGRPKNSNFHVAMTDLAENLPMF